MKIVDKINKFLYEDGSDEYQAFFKSMLKKFGVSSPGEFKDDAKKKEEEDKKKAEEEQRQVEQRIIARAREANRKYKEAQAIKAIEKKANDEAPDGQRPSSVYLKNIIKQLDINYGAKK